MMICHRTGVAKSSFVATGAGTGTCRGSSLSRWQSRVHSWARRDRCFAAGPEHDAALREAVEEGKQHFKQCTRCGKWVCPEACWNGKANLCEGCAPDYDKHLAANRAQVIAEVSRQQMYEKAQAMNYAGAVEMSPAANYAAVPLRNARDARPISAAPGSPRSAVRPPPPLLNAFVPNAVRRRNGRRSSVPSAGGS